MKRLLLLFLAIAANPTFAFGQSGYDDDRVMLQGFYWESCRHGNPGYSGYGDKRWYDIVRENADRIRESRFDLIWLPPPSWAGDKSVGYNPKQYWKFDNAYGSQKQHRDMLESLLKKGVEPIADLVLNHRDGESNWADFKNPDWGPDTICGDDEVFWKGPDEYKKVPPDKRGASETKPSYMQGGSTNAYESFRDIDHSNKQVRRDIIRYMQSLRSLGYRGWRYDMVHGYDAKWLALYNKRTEPTFSVGEYEWRSHGQMRGWIWATATKPADLTTSSNVFDFSTHFSLRDNKGNYKALFGFGNGLGMMGDNTDHIPWKQRSVTFVENHDTGYRTNDDGTPQNDHKTDNFASNWEVEQAYAYILTHPGVPSVYWKHFFDWDPALREKIKALINARKVAGVKSGSELNQQGNAGQKGVYAARVVGSNGSLYVRIGGNDDQWQPSVSGYSDYREYASGAGWRVWVGLRGNPAFQQAPLRGPLPVPVYTEAKSISVSDDLLVPPVP